MWYVYIVECSDGTLYTGITTDVDRRIKEHNTSRKGAKYTRSRRPVRLVFAEKRHSRSDASVSEARIKTLARADKLKLIQKSFTNSADSLRL